MINPNVLFFDEPTTGLDYVSREKIFEILKNLYNNGMTVFSPLIKELILPIALLG